MKTTASSINCEGDLCNGLFLWGDGTAFNFGQSGVAQVSVNDLGGNNCFFYQKSVDEIRDLHSCGEGDPGIFELAFLCVSSGPFPI